MWYDNPEILQNETLLLFVFHQGHPLMRSTHHQCHHQMTFLQNLDLLDKWNQGCMVNSQPGSPELEIHTEVLPGRQSSRPNCQSPSFVGYCCCSCCHNCSFNQFIQPIFMITVSKCKIIFHMGQILVCIQAPPLGLQNSGKCGHFSQSTTFYIIIK
jgi:hypothetical protein